MLRYALVVFLSFWAVCGTSALADERTDKKITESALRETRDIISRELFGHYDLTNLAILKVEDLQGRVSLGHDYGLVKVTLEFSAKRNTTKHPTLNPSMRTLRCALLWFLRPVRRTRSFSGGTKQREVPAAAS